MMIKQQYTVSFVTPAFLGDAEQNGAWRTPPFKALLRQWWRVVAAKDHGYNHERLREAEGRLFGNAWIENNFCKSQVRLRLDRWSEGTLKKSAWPGKDEKKLIHSEVTNKEGKTIPVGAELYLGYGPLNYDKDQKRTVLKANAAIQIDEKAKLELIYQNNQEKLDDILQIIAWFGTIGGRSRNGWGSLLLENGDLAGFDQLNKNNPLINQIARPLQNCLQLDWPHAIGKSTDGNLLIWNTKTKFTNWRDAMKELARVKITFRTALGFTNPNGQLNSRHILAYPVTNHRVNSWGNQSRLANQLRFKVISENNQFFGIAYHLPCSIPKQLSDALDPTDRSWINRQQLSIWQTVHQKLS